ELGRIEEELKALRKKRYSAGARLKLILAKDPAKATGEAIGDLLVCLLMPGFHKMRQAADRAEQTQANLRVAFALACYRREPGRGVGERTFPRPRRSLWYRRGIASALGPGGVRDEWLAATRLTCSATVSSTGSHPDIHLPHRPPLRGRAHRADGGAGRWRAGR